MNALLQDREDETLSGGFTLLELLAVIAIVGVLIAILIPTASAARAAANRTRTKVQFSQWATAVENFRQEYGYYPTFDASGKVNGGASNAADALHPFHDTLAARRRDGSALPAAPAPSDPVSTLPEAQNYRRIAFLNFNEADIFGDSVADPATAHLIHDGFEGTDIAVLVDRNFDGRIDATDYPVLPVVSPPDDATVELRPGGSDFPPSGIRCGVLFYSAPRLARDGSQLIMSWK